MKKPDVSHENLIRLWDKYSGHDKHEVDPITGKHFYSFNRMTREDFILAVGELLGVKLED